mmetsp:Transcript_26348/g.53941  ORF Transcript_26348/g.53941 Transcript_26348/m.53941 type:complete len:487 (-) Transcript_26348:268-1728(-)
MQILLRHAILHLLRLQDVTQLLQIRHPQAIPPIHRTGIDVMQTIPVDGAMSVSSQCRHGKDVQQMHNGIVIIVVVIVIIVTVTSLAVLPRRPRRIPRIEPFDPLRAVLVPHRELLPIENRSLGGQKRHEFLDIVVRTVSRPPIPIEEFVVERMTMSMSRDVGPEEVEIVGASDALEGMEEDAHVLVVPGGVVVVRSYVEDGEGARRGVIAVIVSIVAMVVAVIISEKRTKLLGEIIFRPGILRTVRSPRILLHEYRNGDARRRVLVLVVVHRRTRDRRTRRQRRRILRKRRRHEGRSHQIQKRFVLRHGQRIAVKGDLSNVQFRCEEMAHFLRRRDAEGVEFRFRFRFRFPFRRCVGGIPIPIPAIGARRPPPAGGPRKGRFLRRTEPTVRQSLGPAFLRGHHPAVGIVPVAAGVVPVLDPRAVSAQMEEGRGAAEGGMRTRARAGARRLGGGKGGEREEGGGGTNAMMEEEAEDDEESEGDTTPA